MDESTREQILAANDPKRLGHVLGVEEEAVRLARKWGADEGQARLAALLHDCTKGWDTGRHLQFCGEYNIIIGKFEQENPKLLHAVTGAELARERFGVCDAVCDAVRWHTTGRPGMGLLEKVIYLADKIEPLRDYDGVEEFRKLSYADLDGAVLAVLERGAAKLRKEGGQAHPDTFAAREYYKKERCDGMEPINMAEAVARILDDRKAVDIRVLEVTDVTVLADYFILCTATSSTHIKTLAEEVQFKLKEQDMKPHHVEGHMSGNWILIDFGCVVVHLFLKETRDFYDLERLWRDAKEVTFDFMGDK